MASWLSSLEEGDAQLYVDFVKSLPHDLRAVCVFKAVGYSNEKRIAEDIGATDAVSSLVGVGDCIWESWRSETVVRLENEVRVRWQICLFKSGRTLVHEDGTIPVGRCPRDVEIEFGFQSLLSDALYGDPDRYFKPRIDVLRRLEREITEVVMMNDDLLDTVVSRYVSHPGRPLFSKVTAK